MEGDRIRFGLSAIKGVGEGAIRSVLDAREAAGEKGVNSDDIVSVFMDTLLPGSAGKAKPPPDFVAWMTVKQCSQGALIVHTTDTCLVRQVYTRGGCRIEGIPSY